MSEPNLIFSCAGFDVWGVDESEEAIAAVQRLATELAKESLRDDFGSSAWSRCPRTLSFRAKRALRSE